MKVKYNHHNYLKNNNYIKNALKTPTPLLEWNKHHIIPLQFIDSSPTIDLPYNLHLSLHKNFSNYQLLLDPIGCLIKCIEQRIPKLREELTLGQLLKMNGIKIKAKISLISKKRLFMLIRNGFAYNVKKED